MEKWAEWAQRRCLPPPLPSPTSSASRWSLTLGTKISIVQMSVNFEPKPIMLCSDEHLCDGQMFINIHFNLHYVMFRWTSLWWTTEPTLLVSSGWMEPGLDPLTLPWKRWIVPKVRNHLHFSLWFTGENSGVLPNGHWHHWLPLSGEHALTINVLNLTVKRKKSDNFTAWQHWAKKKIQKLT